MKTLHFFKYISAVAAILIFSGVFNMTIADELVASDAGKAQPNSIKIPDYPMQEFGGPGPVVSGSVEFDALPSKARKFLQKHCDGHAVVKCERCFSSGEFGVQLADGIEFEFDPKGNVIDTEAPEGYALSAPLLRAVVPGKLYNLLVHNGFYQSVTGVRHNGNSYRIRVSDPVFRAVTFDSAGVLTLVVND